MKETEGRKAYRTTCEYHCDSMDPHRRPCNRYFCLNYNCQCTELVRCPRMRQYDYEALGMTKGLRCRHCSHATFSTINGSHSCTLHREYRAYDDRICDDFDYDIATDQLLDKEFRWVLCHHPQNKPFENIKKRKK